MAVVRTHHVCYHPAKNEMTQPEKVAAAAGVSPFVKAAGEPGSVDELDAVDSEVVGE